MQLVNTRSVLTVLAILLPLGVFVPLFTNLGELPYAYYQFMNWIVMITALMLVNEASRHDSTAVVLLFGLVAIVFNPLAPFYLRADIWQIVDLVAAALFILSFWFVKRPA